MKRIVQFIRSSLLPALAIQVALGTSLPKDSLGETGPSMANEREFDGDLSSSDFKFIIANNVRTFMRLMEDLEDYQIESMQVEMEQFFYDLALIAKAKRFALANEKHPRKTLDRLLKETAELRSRTRKKVKKILYRNQFRRYNVLIDKLAPLPNRGYEDWLD